MAYWSMELGIYNAEETVQQDEHDENFKNSSEIVKSLSV